MIQTAESLQQSQMTADITIIGSGAGGAIAAATLAQQGYSIILLEEGAKVTKNDFDQDARRLIKKLYRRSAGLATDDMSIRILQGKTLGGSTTVNWMNCLRTPDNVLDEWARDYGLDDYLPKPMVAHFDAVEQRLHAHTVPEYKHSRSNLIILEGAKRLGIQAGATQNNSINCIGCGTCGLGCPYDAKQDMRLTYLADADAAGVSIFTDCRAEQIVYDSSSQQRIKATLLKSKYGKPDASISITTKRTIVSGGAVMTPLLLKASGLAKSKALGSYFHIHPVTASIGIYDKSIHPTYGAPQTIVSEEYHDLDGKGYGFWVEAIDLEPFLAGVNMPGLGVERRENLKKMEQMCVLITLVRDGADHQNTGTIGWRRVNTKTGHIGIKPTPSIRYNLSPTDKKHLLMGLANSVELQLSAGALEVQTLHTSPVKITKQSQIQSIQQAASGPNQMGMFSAHPQGTARMGTDPSISVVDPTLQMHHYPGIYIMDGSILPTAAGVNPMITILATISRGLELADIHI